MRLFVCILLAACTFAAAVPGQGNAARRDYLFEKNAARFADIGKVTSRSFKFLARLNAGESMDASLERIAALVVKAGETSGYAFTKPGKNNKAKHSLKRYYDTPDYALYAGGYVIREIYPYTKKNGPDPAVFSLTVKEMSPNDFERLARSPLASARKGGKIKFEENISWAPQGMRSYFESTASAPADPAALGRRTLGEYAKLYPALGRAGVAMDVPLAAFDAWSTEKKIGRFALPDGGAMDLVIEGWTRSRDGMPVLVGIDMDLRGDKGYAASPEQMKASEDFFSAVFVNALKEQWLPGSEAFMGSKVRILLDRKRGP